MPKKAKNDHEPRSWAADDAPGLERTAQVGRPVGIKDIAKALGISIGTVDRAIHSRGGISPITKERVLKMSQTEEKNDIGSNPRAHRSHGTTPITDEQNCGRDEQGEH